jgi:hypothetical protein
LLIFRHDHFGIPAEPSPRGHSPYPNPPHPKAPGIAENGRIGHLATGREAANHRAVDATNRIGSDLPDNLILRNRVRPSALHYSAFTETRHYSAFTKTSISGAYHGLYIN